MKAKNPSDRALYFYFSSFTRKTAENYYISSILLKGFIIIFRNRLEQHEQAIVNLRADLEKSQQEYKNTLTENTELREALQNARENTKLIAQSAEISQVFDLISKFFVDKFRTLVFIGDNKINHSR